MKYNFVQIELLIKIYLVIFILKHSKVCRDTSNFQL